MFDDLRQEIEKLKPQPGKKLPPIEKQKKLLAKLLANASASEAFRIFQDKKFRDLAGFSSLDKTGHDRIFNELVLAGLTTLMLLLEAPDLRMDPLFKEFMLEVKEEIPAAYVDQLKELGIEEKYLKDWRRLIAMRYEEYSKDKLKLRNVAMEMEGENLTPKNLDNIQLLLPFQTVAIGCHHHICRGKTESKDELFKTTLRWLGNFYVQIRVPLEGGKITFGRKILAKIRRLF